ncbi:TRIC cation channel family protein [uncultured Corynebacterium sp.]|uniref:TRIC cation channel family protein n=1 Tax=uncultured Corynebacterium sp. TaxID=159447 RepID=UPI002598640A|nr:TRIC cation channel family protein [uncultured Corynebacterium sp.]
MIEMTPTIETTYRVLELIGVFLTSLVAGTIARKMNFDIVGFLLLAIISSLAGGAVRDVLIDTGKVAALVHPEYIWVAMAGAAAAFLTRLHGFTWTMFQYHADMVTIGVWAVTGSTKALLAGVSPLGCVLMALVTATGGSVIRDMMIGRIPALLKNQQMMAIPAIIAASFNVLLYRIGHHELGMVLTPILAFAIAALVYWTGWYIPARQDFAPVNDLAWKLRQSFSGVEESARSAARTIEPDSVREWRHGKMEEIEAEEHRELGADNAGEPTKEEVKKRVGDNPSREEFIDVLYKAYLDAGGSNGPTGWQGLRARRR